MEKRAYKSPLREEQARQTRERILDAALDLFASQGYSATSVAAIAREAGVVPETIYASIGSKRGILEGLIDRVASPDVVGKVLADWTAATGDPSAQLHVIARFATAFWGRTSLLSVVLRKGTGDADIADEWSRRQQGRRDVWVALLGQWPEGTIRTGLALETAGDIAWALSSDDLFTLLVRERKWSSSQYEAWLHGALCHEILASDNASGD